MSYSLTADPQFVVRDDGVTLPVHDEGNDDCRTYLAWLAAGNAAAPAPPPPPPPPRLQLGGTFLAAVADLGWWGWMDQGATAQLAAGKPLDARYWSAIGKADLVLVTDAKLTRVARAAEAARVAASGAPAPTQPVVTLAAAFDRGDAMAAG